MTTTLSRPSETRERVLDLSLVDSVVAVSMRTHDLVASTGVPIARRGSIGVAVLGLLSDREAVAQKYRLDARAASDADLAAAAYDSRGVDGLSTLRGAFAVVVGDRARETAYVLRDPAGALPLFHTRSGDHLAVAPTTTPLLRLPGVARDLDATVLADHLCHRWPFAEETFYPSIRRLPSGWRLGIKNGAASCERYWNPVPEGRAVEFLTEAECGRFDEYFDQAVARAIEHGPAGVFLSGGLDSISVAAVASDLARRSSAATPVGLSLAFPHPDCNEREVQARVADSLGMPLEIVDFDEATGPRGLIAEALRLTPRLSQPLFNPWQPAYRQLMHLGRRRGVTEILTGSGGDEWLGVSPLWAADLIRQGKFVQLANYVAAWRRSYLQSTPKVLRTALWTFGLRPLGGLALHRAAPQAWHRNRVSRLNRLDPAWIAPDASLRQRLMDRAAATMPSADPAGGFYARESRLFLDHALVSRAHEEQYDLGVADGVRIVHPFWDPDLLAYVYRMPPHFLNKGGRSKGLVRETLARRFPALGFERQRKVTAVRFFQSVLSRELPAAVRHLDGFTALDRLRVVDNDVALGAARAMFAQPETQTLRGLHSIWELCNFETWAREHVN